MHGVTLPACGTFDAWRGAARIAISHQIPPDLMDWTGAGGLFGAQPLPDAPGPHQVLVPQGFVKLAGSVIWHSDPERFALLYLALWRIGRKEGAPLLQADPLGRRLHLLAKGVSRDIHKMHAFVRFRECAPDGPQTGPRRRFAAWFEPEHNTLEPGSAFFAKRFGDMDWMIATPRLTAQFRDGVLRFGPAAPRPDLPEDASESLWATYFANIFNPARIKISAMQSEMPRKYWKNLPETRLIPEMLQDAEARVQRMQAAGATPSRPGAAAVSTRYRAAMPRAPLLPETLDQAHKAALHCRRCALCEAATQTVWGTGNADAALMVVGEQPGDQEDLTGRPFVGPAGLVLRDAMAAANIGPDTVWLTNAVKHFKFSPRGKQRLHVTPERTEVDQCRWWLGLELALIRPRVVLAVGATAAFALTGNDGPLAARRGSVEVGLHGGPVLVSWHPAHILRLPEGEGRNRARHDLTQDLCTAQAMALQDEPVANRPDHPISA